MSQQSAAQSTLTLAWDASPSSDVAGYVLSWGTTPEELTSSVDIGNRTDWTVDGLHPKQRYYFTVQAYNTARDLSEPVPVVSNDGVVTGTSKPLIDDRPSLFWRNKVTGELLTWHLSGPTVLATRTLSISAVADTNWRIAGVGDLNGDEHADLLWRHATSGALAVWYLQNNMVIYTGYLSIDRITDPNWRIAGVGDTDGDGFADILWQHRDGRLAVWFLRGTSVLSTQFLSIPRMTNSRWQIAAVADLDSDGRADLVWQSTDGWLATWLLNGTMVTLTQYLSIDRMTDPEWRIVGAGRPDAASGPAVVWQRSDGRIALWYVNGASVVGTIRTTPGRVADTDWAIVGSR